jgi:hypothetical protein
MGWYGLDLCGSRYGQLEGRNLVKITKGFFLPKSVFVLINETETIKSSWA